MRLLIAAVCASLLVLPGCRKADPNNIEDQVEILKANKPTKEKLAACENLRRIGKKEAVPGLIEALKIVNPKIKGEVARVLGELKDPAAIPALNEAMDLSVTEGTDRMSQDANEANKLIARALGDIGGKEAVQPLVRLLKATQNNYVRIEAISALGRLKDAGAVAALSDVALDERLEPFVCKKAILALAQINSPESLPVYLKMAFSERKGLSFYPESSFGVFLLADSAKDKVLALLKDEDKEFIEWAKKRDILHPAIYAKAAQMESDLQDKRAVEPLLKLLKFDDPEPAIKLAVRMNAADALGRIRAKEAVGPIAAMLAEDEANARGAYMRALVQIGDESVLPKFVECSKNGSWSAREACTLGLALLGTKKEIKPFDDFIKDEGKKFDKECNDGIYGDVDCAKEKQVNVESRTKIMAGYKKVLEAVTACADNACVEKLLNDADSTTRERAAYELGRRNAAGSVPALIAAIKRPVQDKVDLNPRFAAICAVDWIASADAAVMAKLKGEASGLEALIESEREKVLTMRIAEEVKRLAVKLERGSK